MLLCSSPVARLAPPLVFVLMVLGELSGCAAPPRFPDPWQVRFRDGEKVVAFDVRCDEEPDYWQYHGPDGRVRAIAYDDGAGSGAGCPGERIELDRIPPADCPHLIIALDGVPFELVQELYQAGAFPLFYPPAPVIACYPSMTDLALAELFHAPRCLAFQAEYYDRAAGRMAGGSTEYLKGENAPWVAQMSYSGSFWLHLLVYLDPQTVFNHELRRMYEVFQTKDAGHAAAYSVGTAGLGTRGGAAAIREYLHAVNALCERIVYDRRGRVKITLVADHGHNLVENRRVSFKNRLRAAGYRPADRLRKPRDVVVIEYGLVTYADFYTDDPAGVATCLLADAAVAFTCYPEGDAVVVRDATGAARITRGPHGFRYAPEGGDPLWLGPILARLRQDGHISPDGDIDDDALFAVTAAHEYPDPLRRIWLTFHGLVAHPPDLIADLHNGNCHGSGFFARAIGRVASTHGSLNTASSTTFVMSMLGELPGALRSSDVLPALSRLHSTAGTWAGSVAGESAGPADRARDTRAPAP